jgi:hypothetical protein
MDNSCDSGRERIGAQAGDELVFIQELRVTLVAKQGLSTREPRDINSDDVSDTVKVKLSDVRATDKAGGAGDY